MKFLTRDRLRSDEKSLKSKNDSRKNTLENERNIYEIVDGFDPNNKNFETGNKKFFIFVMVLMAIISILSISGVIYLATKESAGKYFMGSEKTQFKDQKFYEFILLEHLKDRSLTLRCEETNRQSTSFLKYR